MTTNYTYNSFARIAMVCLEKVENIKMLLILIHTFQYITF